MLCGGLGTRMREETEFRPKPMVEIGGLPLLWHIMKGYGEHGLDEFVLLPGLPRRHDQAVVPRLPGDRLGHDRRHRLGHVSYSRRNLEDWRVTLVDTGADDDDRRPDEAGSPARAATPTSSCCTYGDGVADVDIGRLVAFHRSHGASRPSPASNPRRASASCRATARGSTDSPRSRRARG